MQLESERKALGQSRASPPHPLSPPHKALQSPLPPPLARRGRGAVIYGHAMIYGHVFPAFLFKELFLTPGTPQPRSAPPACHHHHAVTPSAPRAIAVSLSPTSTPGLLWVPPTSLLTCKATWWGCPDARWHRWEPRLGVGEQRGPQGRPALEGTHPPWGWDPHTATLGVPRRVTCRATWRGYPRRKQRIFHYQHSSSVFILLARKHSPSLRVFPQLGLRMRSPRARRAPHPAKGCGHRARTQTGPRHHGLIPPRTPITCQCRSP